MSADAKTIGTDADDAVFIDHGREVLTIEAAAVAALTQRLDSAFAQACRRLLACQGRIVVLGMGKSGHIGGKLAATLASTGTPAFFVHPAEASHGDLGMITVKDVVLALSNSGETEEILTIVPMIKRLGVALIALTGNLRSSLARHATVVLDVSITQEACPLGLAPTASTTATLAMGDALAVAVLAARGFDSNDFARAHPGGRLGRRLLVRVEDIMHVGAEIPRVGPDAPLRQALLEMTRKRLGMTIITDAGDRVLGVFTDGDLARALENQVDIHGAKIGQLMNSPGKTITATLLAAEALHLMETQKINAFPVVADDGRLIGAFNMHDLLSAGIL